MKVWVMGAGGFIGRRLVESLRLDFHAVTPFVRSKASWIRGALRVDLSSPNVTAVLRRAVKAGGRPDIVFHLASRQPGPYSLTDYVSSNLTALGGVLAFFQEIPPRQFIYTSTLSVYGHPIHNPVREDAEPRPIHPYAATKLAAEGFLPLLASRCPVTVFRLPSVFGQGQADSFVDGLAKAAMRQEPLRLFGGGRIIRDALHVRDVIGVLLACLRRPVGRALVTVNLGAGRLLTNRDYAVGLIKCLKSRSRVVTVSDTPAGMSDLYADISLARRLFRFRPMTLSESLRLYAHDLLA